jgi:acetyl-CoA carboxylase biotin carboxyl carrier protein
VDLSDLKEILRILEEQDITEFELEQGGVKLRICRSAAAPAGNPSASPVATYYAPPLAAVPAPQVAAPGVGLVPAAVSPPAPAGPAGETPASDEIVVKSPIVGTFYRAPDPNAPPFVSVGDRVKVGQILCIIEAMKLMNEIEAELAGEIVKVHPENGQPVQYGDPLFTVRRA